jgi:hypothetical protein
MASELNPRLIQFEDVPKRPPRSNNNNLNYNYSINFKPQKSNVVENVFITIKISSNSKSKSLIQAPNDFFKGLINNKKNVKVHKLYGGKTLLIYEKQYNFKNLQGTAKIWLVFNEQTQMLDYVIKITSILKNNSNKITKGLIPYLINSIDCNSIIYALKKFGINIDEKKFNQEKCNIFRWSFHVSDLLFSIRNKNGPARPLNSNNNNGPARPLNSNNNNGPVRPLNSNNNNGPVRPLNNS